MVLSREIYLDNSATTRVLPEVAETMLKVAVEEYGNPSSLHGKGFQGEQVLKKARGQLARALKVPTSTLYFTSGGTEANNLAILGAALARRRRGKHLITSSIEHASVLNTFQRLATHGFEVTYLPADQEGLVDPLDLARHLRSDTVLVSIMTVNNEIGTLQPVQELAGLTHQNSPAIFHTDAVQALGKVPLDPVAQGLDLVTVSGHKIHAAKGVGALYLRQGLRIEPLLTGGDQEQGLRPGTENVPGIAGLGLAAEELGRRDPRELMTLKERLYQGILERVSGVKINGSLNHAAPQILNLSFDGVSKGEVLVHWLEQEGVFISTGSACHSRRTNPSHVLRAIGLKGEHLTGAVRFSLSYLNTAEEIDRAAEAVAAAVDQLRQL